jgi:hypothetical protein
MGFLVKITNGKENLKLKEERKIKEFTNLSKTLNSSVIL